MPVRALGVLYYMRLFKRLKREWGTLTTYQKAFYLIAWGFILTNMADSINKREHGKVNSITDPTFILSAMVTVGTIAIIQITFDYNEYQRLLAAEALPNTPVPG